MEEERVESKGNISSLFRSAASYSQAPENQFAHAAGLLTSQGQKIEKNSDISELLNQACFLGLQNNDQYIRFWQVDAMLLTNLFTMAQKARSQALMEVFNMLYTNFKFEIRLTGNKDGLERKLQHSFGGAGNAAEIGRVLEGLKQMQGESYGAPQEKKGLFG